MLAAAPRYGVARKGGRFAAGSTGRGNFPRYDFPRRRGLLKSGSTGFNNLPGGAPERIKRGKEKVVTRAVACAGMKFSGTSERGNTALSELE